MIFDKMPKQRSRRAIFISSLLMIPVMLTFLNFVDLSEHRTGWKGAVEAGWSSLHGDANCGMLRCADTAAPRGTGGKIAGEGFLPQPYLPPSSTWRDASEMRETSESFECARSGNGVFCSTSNSIKRGQPNANKVAGSQVDSNLSSTPEDPVDEALKKLQAANVAFNSPGHAKVGEVFIIETQLSKRIPGEQLRAFIHSDGDVESSPLKVSDRVAATLVGGSAFEVQLSGPTEQWVSSSEPTVWKWTVTPKSAGPKQVLLLTFDAIINVSGKDNHRNVNTFQREIKVDVAWPESIAEWLDFIKKTGENASWVWATLLLPIIGGAWGWMTGIKPKTVDETNTPPGHA